MAEGTDRVLRKIDNVVDSFITHDFSVSLDAMRSMPVPADKGVTRADLFHSGDLIEAPSAMVCEAGLSCPVACTRAAWEDCVAWTGADTDRTGVPQDQDGRLWDVLRMTRVAINQEGQNASDVTVELYRVPRTGRSTERCQTFLSASIGPDDFGDLVITIKLPDEN
ncbi:hypothetical protein GCM10029978_067200 [Actinoallomurus acanthiterrae]